MTRVAEKTCPHYIINLDVNTRDYQMQSDCIKTLPLLAALLKKT